ncbi:hypothetical protein Ancab_001705 [Ancistrocladus abbreviatus]
MSNSVDTDQRSVGRIHVLGDSDCLSSFSSSSSTRVWAFTTNPITPTLLQPPIKVSFSSQFGTSPEDFLSSLSKVDLQRIKAIFPLQSTYLLPLSNGRAHDDTVTTTSLVRLPANVKEWKLKWLLVNAKDRKSFSNFPSQLEVLKVVPATLEDVLTLEQQETMRPFHAVLKEAILDYTKLLTLELLKEAKLSLPYFTKGDIAGEEDRVEVAD